MPWKETCVENERLKFVAAWAESEDENFSALCREYRISRKTGYKYLNRYEKEGPEGLRDRRPGPRESMSRQSPEVLEAIVAMRKVHPTWGPKKVHARLIVEQPKLSLPSVSTVGAILKKHGLVRPRKRRLRVPGPNHPEDGLQPGDFPNDLWSLDFKGDFEVGDGTRVYPLTVMDNASRYLLGCTVMTKTNGAAVRREFERLFEEFGLPKRLRMDNGSPFVTRSLGGLSRLGIWWIRLGIVPERIDVGHPEQNGAHERMHRTMKEDVCLNVGKSPTEQQHLMDHFRGVYNQIRPHESLGMKTPGRIYTLSMRTFPCQEKSPLHGPGKETRQVGHSGAINLAGSMLSIGKAFAGESVGVKEQADGWYELNYGPVWLARVRQEEGEWLIQGDPKGEATLERKRRRRTGRRGKVQGPRQATTNTETPGLEPG